MKKIIPTAALALAVFASPAGAAETEYSGIACGGGKRIVLESGSDLTVLGTETWVIQTPQSTFKPWENATAHCVGYVRIAEGKRTAKGSCRWMDAGGDMFIGETEEQPGKAGTWTFLAGTGKWKGIKGGGTFQAMAAGKPAQDGTVQFCWSHNGNYTLP